MALERRRLEGLARVIGFSVSAVLLSALVHVGTASAQCGPTSDKNTACGTGALAHNTGDNNTAFGFNALFNNTGPFVPNPSEDQELGEENTAFGSGALLNNTIGKENTAIGVAALLNNKSAAHNTAIGAETLLSNQNTNDNTAVGFEALAHHGALIGGDNTAVGAHASVNNEIGFGNTAVGWSALESLPSGDSNVAIGFNAGANIVGGQQNIDIGSLVTGPQDESSTIRIGAPENQTKTYIAGIFGQEVDSSSGVPVLVDNLGKLGVTQSSVRYKRDIRDMGGASAGLMRLRPVTFRYKNDRSGTLQYGLLAEEVARVYPELVASGTDGKIQSVRYLELTALLLNELQKQSKQLERQTDKLETQANRSRELAQRLEAKDRQLAMLQREIYALKQQNASINALSERLTALEQEAGGRTRSHLAHLASK